MHLHSQRGEDDKFSRMSHSALSFLFEDDDETSGDMDLHEIAHIRSLDILLAFENVSDGSTGSEHAVGIDY
jgi:hypothetical protein